MTVLNIGRSIGFGFFVSRFNWWISSFL